MATYLIVNLAVLVVIAALLAALHVQLHWPSRTWWISLISLLILTAIFDSLMVGYGFIGYNPDNILNISIGKAPIEDFFYPLVAMILIPTIWKLLEKKV